VSLGEQWQDSCIEWKRLGELYETLFATKTERFTPGALGNCFFLSVLASMSAQEIKEMFHTKETNEAGIFLVYFYVNGVKKSVIVDDYIPCRNGRPMFSSAEAAWVSILEKAWAKLHGCYQDSASGKSSHAACHILGVPSRSYKHEQES
jgi:hypothetical protein